VDLLGVVSLSFKEWGCAIYSLYIHIFLFVELCSNLGASFTKVQTF
jgi:hypothetical protein